MDNKNRQNRNKRKQQRKREKQRARYQGNKSLAASSQKLDKLIKTFSSDPKPIEKNNGNTKKRPRVGEEEQNGGSPANLKPKGKNRKKNSGIDIVKPIFKNVKSRNLDECGRKALEWVIHPTTCEAFMNEYFDKKVLLIQREHTNSYYDGLLSKDDIDTWLRQGKLSHNVDFTLTRYINGKRENIMQSSSAKAVAKEVWEQFDQPNNASLRLLRPQQHSDILWKVVASIESFFGSCGGANAYLTPAGSQGFAPHYDDIDAFIIQLEGKKHWKVYTPYAGEDEELKALFPKHPRNSSRDFSEEEISDLKETIDVELSAGDILYIPRGFVHHARSSAEEHSLHVTISVGQKHTWGDLLLRALPRAIETAIRDDQSECQILRESLPKDYHRFMGVMHSDQNTDTRRMEFTSHVVKLVRDLLLERLDVDLASDQHFAKFLHDRHKPRGVIQNDSDDSDSDSDSDTEEKMVDIINKLNLDSKIKLTVRDAARLTVEEDAAVVYHSLKNTRKYHEMDPRGLEFELEDAEAIETILKSNPEEEPIMVKSLPHESDKDRLRVVQFLLTEKIVMLV